MKNVQKSIRMTDEVFEAVDRYRGDGFNEKLENLVMDYLHGREKFQRELDRLQELVHLKRDELVRLQDRVRAAEVVERRLGPLVNAVADLLSAE